MVDARKVVPDETPSKISIQSYWKIFWRKKFFLLVPLALSFGVSVVGVRHLTPIYKSSAMLSIEDKTMLSPTMERYMPNVTDRSQMQNQQYRAMIETRVKNTDFLRLIVEDLGLQRSEQVRRFVQGPGANTGGQAPPDQFVMRYLVSLLRRKIDVENPMPGYFSIGVYDTDPTTAYVLAEKVSEKFLDVMRQEQIQGIREAGAFSDEQLAIYKEKLEASEKELAVVKRELEQSDVENNPIGSANITQAQVLERTMGADKDRSEIALKHVREKLVELFNLVPSSETITSDPTVRTCENKLLAFGEGKMLHDLSNDREKLSEEPFNAATAELRDRIASMVQTEYRNLSPEVYPLIVEYYYERSLAEYYSSIHAKLVRYIDQYSKSYERKPGLDRESSRLAQEVETNRAIYKAFLESKTSARIGEAAQTTNIGMSMRIIDRAEKPSVPVKPNPLRIIVLAVFFGGACGLGAILVTEYLDDSFRSIEEVERILKTPVIGTVPKMDTEFAWEKRQRGVVIVSWVVGVVLLVALMSGVLYVYAGHLKSSGLGLQLKQEQAATGVQP